MPTHGDAHYSFPVVTGILASDPASTRAARMKIFEQFTSDLDSSGEKISQKLSEVDLSNPEDVKAVIPDDGKDVLVHFGDTDFLNRYRKFEEHLQEWRTQYPNLASVDMRYERQVVLDMQPGAAAANAGGSVSIVPTPASTDGASTAAPAQAAAKPVVRAIVKAHAKPHAKAHAATKKAAVSKWKRPARAKSHHAAAKTHSRVVHHAAANSRYHSSQVVHP
jgi:cell division protein FtsQ